jgi:hypothetical protein
MLANLDNEVHFKKVFTDVDPLSIKRKKPQKHAIFKAFGRLY